MLLRRRFGLLRGEILVAEEEIQVSRWGKRIGDIEGGGVLTLISFGFQDQGFTNPGAT